MLLSIEEFKKKAVPVKATYQNYTGEKREYKLIEEMGNKQLSIETMKHNIQLDRLKESYIKGINEALQYADVYGQTAYQKKEIFHTILNTR